MLRTETQHAIIKNNGLDLQEFPFSCKIQIVHPGGKGKSVVPKKKSLVHESITTKYNLGFTALL